MSVLTSNHFDMIMTRSNLQKHVPSPKPYHRKLHKLISLDMILSKLTKTWCPIIKSGSVASEHESII